MTGIQDVVFRIPEEWDPVWFQGIIQDLFQYADTRNAIGSGVSISGNSDEVATISSTTLSEAYVVTEASSELTDERVLAGETGVIDITDGGAGNNVTVSVETNGLDFEKLQQIATNTYLGRVSSGTGDIEATATNTAFNKDFGTIAGTVLEGDTTAADIGAEPAFTKNTAFNKDFGTVAGTVSEGDHLHTGVYEPADPTILKDADIGVTVEAFVTKNTAWNKDFGTIAGTVLEGDTSLGDLGGQPLDATLTTIAATDPTTDQINYFTGLNVASVTSLTPFARTLIDDTTQGAMQTTLNVDPSGTDNSTDVTLDGTPNYITIVGQLITRALINLTSHVTGILPVANGGTGSATEKYLQLTGGTLTGDIVVDNGTTPTYTARSSAQGWSGGEDLGGYIWYNEDGSGIGAHNIAAIKVIQNGGSTTPTADMVFYASDTNAVMTERFRIDGRTGKVIFINDLVVTSGNETFLNLPSSAGTAGSLWSNAGIVTVA